MLTRSLRNRQFSHLASIPRWCDVVPEVHHALQHGHPVVALESTIISHGMPFPENLKTAQEVENCIRNEGAVPATIAIMKGKVKVGLSDQDLHQLAELGPSKVHKTSRRDMAAVVGWKLNGATTVSATMLIAHQVGIPIFVTGGIGGVHRGGESSMDISADLTELGRTNVAVICAGVKSILDIGRTLEYLETQGVPVVSVGESSDFPAFYMESSGYKSPWHARTPEAAAELLMAHNDMQLQNGLVFGVPIPMSDAAHFTNIPEAIDQAIEECRIKNITSKEVTPFLLQRVKELTKGDSLRANIALIKNNARVGSRIAVEFAKIRNQQKRHLSTSSRPRNHRPIFIGGSAMDVISKLKPVENASQNSWEPFFHTSSPSITTHSLGGVARNAAECCFRVSTGHSFPYDQVVDSDLRAREETPFAGPAPLLVTPVGKDIYGKSIVDTLQSMGMPTDGLIMSKENSTAVYNAILDPTGKLILAGAAMDILSDSKAFGVEAVGGKLDSFLRHTTPLVAMDANPSIDVMEDIVKRCRSVRVPVWFEPTSVPKCSQKLKSRNILNPSPFSTVMYCSPNIEELVTISNICKSFSSAHNNRIKTSQAFLCEVGPSGEVQGLYKTSESRIRKFADLMEHVENVLPFIPTVFLKMGKDGILLAQRLTNNPSDYFESSHSIRIRHYLPESSVDKRIVNVTGAGDSFVGALIAGMNHMIIQDHCTKNFDKHGHHKEDMIQTHIRLFHQDDKPQPLAIDSLVRRGREAAELSLLQNEAVHPKVGTLMAR